MTHRVARLELGRRAGSAPVSIWEQPLSLRDKAYPIGVSLLAS